MIINYFVIIVTIITLLLLLLLLLLLVIVIGPSGVHSRSNRASYLSRLLWVRKRQSSLVRDRQNSEMRAVFFRLA